MSNLFYKIFISLLTTFIKTKATNPDIYFYKRKIYIADGFAEQNILPLFL